MNPSIQNALSHHFSGEPNEAHLQAVHGWLSGLAIDSHPNRTRSRRKKAMKLEGRLKAHCSMGYALARNDYSLPQVVG